MAIDRLRFRYTIEGDNPPWRPLHAFDDGRKVYIEFPRGIAQGEMPPHRNLATTELGGAGAGAHMLLRCLSLALA